MDEEEQEKINFRKHLRNWRKRVVDWKGLYPAELKGKGTEVGGCTVFDPESDLMQVDLGVLLKRLREENEVDGRYGPFPRMAQCYLGAQNSVAFVESLNSVLGQVMTNDRTLLNETELEHVALLRMNKAWIKRMKVKYASELRAHLAAL